MPPLCDINSIILSDWLQERRWTTFWQPNLQETLSKGRLQLLPGSSIGRRCDSVGQHVRPRTRALRVRWSEGHAVVELSQFMLTLRRVLLLLAFASGCVQLQAQSIDVTVHWDLTSVMIYHRGASLSEQHTDLLICHCTKQDLSHTSTCRYVEKVFTRDSQVLHTYTNS